jgi:hypothetical protein
MFHFTSFRERSEFTDSRCSPPVNGSRLAEPRVWSAPLLGPSSHAVPCAATCIVFTSSQHGVS